MTEGQSGHLFASLRAIEDTSRQMERAARDGTSSSQRAVCHAA